MTRDPYKVSLSELKNDASKHLFSNGVVRPYLRELFLLLKN